VDAAWALIDAGLNVLLLNGKLPAWPKADGGAGWKDATLDLGTLSLLAERYPRATNVGIQPGRSGLLGVDLDETKPAETVPALLRLRAVAEEHGGLPETLTCRTGSGGRHLYFHAPSDRVIGQGQGVPTPAMGGLTESGVDYRCGSGYLVAPGSIHPKTGRPYRWETASGLFERELVVDAPEWLLEFLDPPDGGRPAVPEGWTPSAPSTSEQTRVGGLVRARVARLSALGEGMGRRTELQKAAGCLGGWCWTGFPESDLRASMYDAAHACGHYDADTVRAIDDAIAWGLARPRPLPPDSLTYRMRQSLAVPALWRSTWPKSWSAR
jgi:hypothetical protein